MLVPVTPKMVFNSLPDKLPEPGFKRLINTSTIRGANKDRKLASISVFLHRLDGKNKRGLAYGDEPFSLEVGVKDESFPKVGKFELSPYPHWLNDGEFLVSCNVTDNYDGENIDNKFSYVLSEDENFREMLERVCETHSEIGSIKTFDGLNIQKLHYLITALVLPGMVMSNLNED